MPKKRRGWRNKPVKDHDKIALRKMYVEPVKGVTRKRNVVSEILNNPPIPKVNKKAEEELRNQGKVLCGSLHPKNRLACVVPVEEHEGKKHEAWNLSRGGSTTEVYTKLQWDV